MKSKLQLVLAIVTVASITVAFVLFLELMSSRGEIGRLKDTIQLKEFGASMIGKTKDHVLREARFRSYRPEIGTRGKENMPVITIPLDYPSFFGGTWRVLYLDLENDNDWFPKN